MIGSRGTGPAFLKYLLFLPVIFLLLFLSSSSRHGSDAAAKVRERGDFDLVINGIEITPERSAKVLFSRPYYVYTEQLVVRRDEDGIRGLANLAGKRIGTLMGAVSQTMLQQVFRRVHRRNALPPG
ncbi:MAG TPA: transporter substrate-binding domain-containing protein [Candidatus Deferrimicrobiaceae bacterium]|nr:transporter substrate-binding domain-containing protein [Candidatus Deferrimicrobiaceae bacterium]